MSSLVFFGFKVVRVKRSPNMTSYIVKDIIDATVNPGFAEHDFHECLSNNNGI